MLKGPEIGDACRLTYSIYAFEKLNFNSLKPGIVLDKDTNILIINIGWSDDGRFKYYECLYDYKKLFVIHHVVAGADFLEILC